MPGRPANTDTCVGSRELKVKLLVYNRCQRVERAQPACYANERRLTIGVGSGSPPTPRDPPQHRDQWPLCPALLSGLQTHALVSLNG